MLLIPALRLKQGRLVNGADGSPLREKPADVVLRLLDAGAERIELMDEPSISQGSAQELAAIEAIATAADAARLMVVTGVREEEAVQSYLDAGAGWLVLGNRAASAPHVLKDLCLEFPGHIMMGLNVRDGRIAGDSHSKLSNHELVDLAEHFQSDGVEGIVYQEVDKDDEALAPADGTAKAIAGAISVPVMVAGRIESRKDIERALELTDSGVAGVIMNRPLDGEVRFTEAVKLLEAVS